MLLGLPVIARFYHDLAFFFKDNSPMFNRRNEGNESVIQDGSTGLLFNTPEEFIVAAEKLIQISTLTITSTNDCAINCDELRTKPTFYTTNLWSEVSHRAFEYVNKHHLLQTEANAYKNLVYETCSRLERREV